MEEGSEEEESQRDNRRKSEERVIWFILPAVNLVHEAGPRLNWFMRPQVALLQLLNCDS